MNGVTILFAYAVIMILATVILTKKEKNVERFCVGSRSENWLMSALSIAATWIWAPAFIAWIEQNKPSGLEIINTGQDMEWLKKHPDMLFPDKSNKAAQWFHIVQHRGQARYYKEHQLEILLLGRRKADGNYVGKDNIYTNSAGITRYSPLAEWRHEDILAYIHYYDVKLPPIYDWEKGYLCGTHPWPARQYMETEQQGWKEVYDIDKTIVENAAQHFDGARDFLKAIK